MQCFSLWTPLRSVVAGLVMLAAMGGSAVQAQTRAPEAQSKYWIFLADRPPTDGPQLDRVAEGPAPNATRTAVERRQRRAAPGAARLTRPVAPTYLASLRDAGVVPLVRSRWLHAVSAHLAPDRVPQVRALPFVRAVGPVGVGVDTRTGLQARPLSGPLGALDAEAPGASPSAFSPSASPVLLPPTALAVPAGRNANASADPDVEPAYGPSQQQLALMNALPPLRRGVNGHGVRLGFLDTRYRGLQHPAFDVLRNERRIVDVRDFTAGTQTNNHGGAVVSVAAGYAPGTLVGPAHGATIYAAATEYTASETNVEEDDFVAGLEWLESRGVDVVNVSLGYTRFDAGERSYTVDDLDGDTGVTTRAVDAAVQLGVTVVVSAGNSGCDAPANCWYYLSTPADADSAITVGAVGPDSLTVPFSSRGPTADGRTKPDVVALGRGVVAAWNDADYSRVDGTSFSSPLVAGVVAQMLQVNPDLAPMDVRALLRQTASQPDAPDNDRGWGLVDADAAVRAADTFGRERPPAALQVDAPYPNPATDRITLTVRAPAAGSLRVAVYDLLGRSVQSSRRYVTAGYNPLSLSVSDLAPGPYFYRLRTDDAARTGTFTVIR